MVKMGLFEELSQIYPLEIVEPYGEVLIVPNKAFKPEWKERLEAENVKIYANSYMGKTCFFLKKKGKTEGFKAKVERKYFQRWTEEEEERLLQLANEGLTVREIAERLGRSVGAIRVKLLRLEKKTAQNGNFAVKENEADSEEFKELTQALTVLYEAGYKRVCLLVLRELEKLVSQ